jgi:Protein of unknown function (DUF4231)
MSCPDPEIKRVDSPWSPFAWLGRLSPTVVASWQDAVKLINRLQSKGLTPEQCRTLKSRWVRQAIMYERLWRSQRWGYYLLRIPIIAAATTIPVLASLSVPKEVTAFVGLGVALFTALDGFLQLGSRWQLHRHTATELGFEGWAFLELSGGYAHKEYPAAYGEFIGRLERMNRRAAISYLDQFHADSNKNGSSDGEGATGGKRKPKRRK